MRTEKELLTEALQVQDACNLSGVVRAFARATQDLWALSRERDGGDTDWVNTHPVCRLYADKVAHLTRSHDEHAVYDAYHAAFEARD